MMDLDFLRTELRGDRTGPADFVNPWCNHFPEKQKPDRILDWRVALHWLHSLEIAAGHQRPGRGSRNLPNIAAWLRNNDRTIDFPAR